MGKIYVVGSSNTDMVVKCKSLPGPGETVLGGEFVQVRGGKGANQAVAAARLGGNVSFFCRVGNDASGQQSLEAYKKEGIDVSNIVADNSGASGVALIVVDGKGENYIAVAPGVNANLKPDDVESLRLLLKPGDVVLMQLEIPMETVMRAAQIGDEKGAIVMLNPAPAPPAGLPKSICPHLDFILPNRHEAEALVGAKTIPEVMCQGLLETGITNVIITLGKSGCIWSNKHGVQSLPAYPVKAMDSTAAGDAFAGGLAVALTKGWSVPKAIQWAQKAAALSVMRMGAQTSLPTLVEIEKYPFPDIPGDKE